MEAVRRAPRESRGLAMGAYTAFLDLSLGVTGPALGLVAGVAGLGSVFLVSTLVVLGSAAVAVLQPPERIERLRKTLLAWLADLFRGDYGEDYYRHHSHIGRMHVRVELPQRFMFSAMSIIPAAKRSLSSARWAR